MKSPTRWGILGTGTIATQFAQGLKSVDQAQLHAVASRDETRAKAFAQRFSAPRGYGAYEELIADADVDIVYIATPHHRHRDDCVMTLEAGKATLCEKPFALNVQQAEQVYDLAKSKNTFCMEAMWMRFMPLVQTLKSRIDSGEIGDIEMINVDFGVPAPKDPENRFFNLQLGGGALLDRGVYCLSLAQYLLGKPSGLVSQVTLGPTGVDEQSTISLSYESGAIAVLNSSLNTKLRNEALVLGSRGSLTLGEYFFRPETLTLTPYQAPTALSDPGSSSSRLKESIKSNKLLRGAVHVAKGLRSGGSITRQPVDGNGYNYEAAEATRCVSEGLLESPHMTWQDSIDVIRCMDQVRDQWGLRYPGDSS